MRKFLATSLLCLMLTACNTNTGKETTTETNTKNEVTTETNTETSQNTDTSEKANENEVATDAISTPSVTGDKEEVKKSLSKDGNWITAVLNDITLEEELKVDGEFHSKGDITKEIYRKLALYSQDADKKVTGTFTLTVPKMTVTSENFRIQEGTVVGDIDVDANGFELKNATVEGNITFTKPEFKESAKLEEGKVTGEIK